MPPASGSPPRAASPDLFARPKPRPPMSPARSAQIRVRNRRREYLERHPDYFGSTEHELSDPLLYDALVRTFQTPAEREAEGEAKGYSGVLESSLLRGEARLEQMARAHPGQAPPPPAQEGVGDTNFSVEADLAGAPPSSREEARARWEEFLRDRFVHGRDGDFDYPGVDEDDDLDALERRDREEAWFDEEDPAWAREDDEGGGGGGEGGAGARTEAGRGIEGETGIQDF